MLVVKGSGVVVWNGGIIGGKEEILVFVGLVVKKNFSLVLVLKIVVFF